MSKQCKKCGSENLYLEPQIEGQDVMTADMVALKCKDCGSWLKWCPKDERKYYYANTQQKQDTKWQKLKEWLKLQIDGLNEQLCDYDFDSDCREISIENFEIMLQQMRELEGEDE